jgi:hypothetical protein
MSDAIAALFGLIRAECLSCGRATVTGMLLFKDDGYRYFVCEGCCLDYFIEHEEHIEETATRLGTHPINLIRLRSVH